MKRRTAIVMLTATAAAAVTAGTATVAMANDDHGGPGHVLSQQDVAARLAAQTPEPTAQPTGGGTWTPAPADFTPVATAGGTVTIACHGDSGEAQAKATPIVGWHQVLPAGTGINVSHGIVLSNDAGRRITVDWTCGADSVVHPTVTDTGAK